MADEQVHDEIQFEEKDINISFAVYSGIGLTIVVTAVAMVIVALVMNGLDQVHTATQAEPHPLLSERPAPPGPRMQPNPIDNLSGEEEWLIMRSNEDRILENYGWVNQEEGIVHIPIDRAILIVAGEDPDAEEPAR